MSSALIWVGFGVYRGIVCGPLYNSYNYIAVGYKKNEFTQLLPTLKSNLGITKEVTVHEHTGHMLQAIGNNFFWGKAGILINPMKGVNDLSPEDKEFAMAHELCHIKNNDVLKLFAFAAVVDLVTNVAFAILCPTLLATSAVLVFVPSAVAFLALSILSKYCERRADLDALAVCSPNTKMNAYKFIENVRLNHIELRNDIHAPTHKRIWRLLTISAEGNNRLDFFHPSFSTREKYLKEATSAASAA